MTPILRSNLKAMIADMMEAGQLATMDLKHWRKGYPEVDQLIKEVLAERALPGDNSFAGDK